MADPRSFEERQQDLVGVVVAARLVGVEEIERQRRTESSLCGRAQSLEAENERLADAIRDMLDVSTGWTRSFAHQEMLLKITELGNRALSERKKQEPA